jgi:hypothetical protein
MMCLLGGLSARATRRGATTDASLRRPPVAIVTVL